MGLSYIRREARLSVSQTELLEDGRVRAVLSGRDGDDTTVALVTARENAPALGEEADVEIRWSEVL